MCVYKNVCTEYNSHKACDIVIMQPPVCFRPLISETEPVAEVPCSDGLLLKLLEEMRTETVECLWDHAEAEDLHMQTCESMTSRLEDFFNQKIYDIKRKQ